MVEIFKTDVRNHEAARKLLDILSKTFPGLMINFDLEDCDKILRVEALSFNPVEIANIMYSHGFQCEIIE